MIRILYLDVSASDRMRVRETLERELAGVMVAEAASRQVFETLLQSSAFDVVLADLDIPGLEGMQVLEAVQQIRPRLPIIVVTDAGSEATAVEALKHGATDYVIKALPDLQRLPYAILAVLQRRQQQKTPEAAASDWQASPGFLQSALNALSIRLAILDATGTIIMVNAAWRHFAVANDDHHVGFGVGRNYLEICETASGERTEGAREAAQGIRDILAGRRDMFYLEYPCHSPEVRRWFLMRATRFVSDGRMFVAIAHETITERKRAEEARLRHVQQMQAVRTVMLEISRELDLSRLLDTINRQVLALIDTAEAAVVFIWDEATQCLIPRAWYGMDPRLRDVRLPLGEGVTGTVAARRIGMLVNDYPHSTYFIRDPIVGLKALMAEPLLYRERLLGVLTLGHTASGRPFTPQDQELLVLFAAQAAVAMAHAQLFTEVQQRLTQLAEANQTLQAEIAKREQLERDLLAVSDREQRQLGQELHDSLGQQLTGIELLGRALEKKLQAKALPESLEAGELSELIHQAIIQANALARGLYPVDLESGGLPAALEMLAAKTRILFQVSCLVDEIPFSYHLQPDIAMHLYRIVQEAVKNAVQHGQARRITIHAGATTDGFRLCIDDDGVGFSPAATDSRGVGLRLMQYRASRINATVTVHGLEPRGTRVSCVLPRFARSLPTTIPPGGRG